jgi:hypothetical protein
VTRNLGISKQGNAMNRPILRYVLAFCFLLVSAAASAQGANGTITGVVKDGSGAVLPGVTVEAASPALIEKVRTAVTDGQGLYRIVDLRPGALHRDLHLAWFQHVEARRARADRRVHGHRSMQN